MYAFCSCTASQALNQTEYCHPHFLLYINFGGIITLQRSLTKKAVGPSSANMSSLSVDSISAQQLCWKLFNLRTHF